MGCEALQSSPQARRRALGKDRRQPGVVPVPYFRRLRRVDDVGRADAVAAVAPTRSAEGPAVIKRR